MKRYILDENGAPVIEPDLMKWGQWMERGIRRVAQETILESTVSTVFIGTDHGYGESTPILWETMVFGGPLDQEQTRCAGSRADAEAMHREMVEKVIKSRNDNDQ